MEDKKLIKQLKREADYALEQVIHIYTSYVSTVIAHQLGGFYDSETVEELTSDVFFVLWQNRHRLSTNHLRGWLGTTARNRARTYLRTIETPCDVLEEDCILISDDSIFASLNQKEQSALLKKALQKIDKSDREVLVRYYYYNQTTSCISDEMSLNRETVKSKLQRGREKLRILLERGGYFR